MLFCLQFCGIQKLEERAALMLIRVGAIHSLKVLLVEQVPFQWDPHLDDFSRKAMFFYILAVFALYSKRSFCFVKNCWSGLLLVSHKAIICYILWHFSLGILSDLLSVKNHRAGILVVSMIRMKGKILEISRCQNQPQLLQNPNVWLWFLISRHMDLNTC